MPGRQVPRTTWGMIDAREVRFPVATQDTRLLLAGFTGPTEAVRAFIPGDALQLVEVSPGRASLMLVLAHHLRSDIGPFRAASLTTVVVPCGSDAADEAGHFVCAGATADAFQNELMYWAFGMPHESDGVRAAYDGTEVTFRVACAADESLAVSLRRPPDTTPPATTTTRNYGLIDDDIYVIPLVVTSAPAPVDPASVRLTVGTGPLAEALRHVGFPAASPEWRWAEACRITSRLPLRRSGARRR